MYSVVHVISGEVNTLYVCVGGEDFTQISAAMMFDPSGTSRICSGIVIMSDDLLEDLEFFTVALSNPLEDVVLNISISNATVTINDTSCKCVYRCLCY